MTLLPGGAAAIAAHLTYRETVPHPPRGLLAEQVRERDEAIFAELQNEHASIILGPRDPNTVRVRRIAREIITGAHAALAIKQRANTRTSRHHDGLEWMHKLNWEVIVVRDQNTHMECLAGAGKIIVHAGVFDHFKTDAEIAASIAHEVLHRSCTR